MGWAIACYIWFLRVCTFYLYYFHVHVVLLRSKEEFFTWWWYVRDGSAMWRKLILYCDFIFTEMVTIHKWIVSVSFMHVYSTYTYTCMHHHIWSGGGISLQLSLRTLSFVFFLLPFSFGMHSNSSSLFLHFSMKSCSPTF